MSIENAILDHAAALRELAAAIRATIGAGAPAHDVAVAVSAPAAAAAQVAAEVAKPTTAKEAVAAAMAAAAAKAEEAPAPAPAPTPASAAAATPLSYEKDVQPLLVQVGKNRDQLVELLREFGAKNGAGIKDADYPAVVAKATAIIAARG
jgi:hypothetical protein